ncbi:hypothetical protein EYF80_016872 [Liparis tanakae]|uniref:Uncharacterized protein n=1 Tax=Liparis tanakae TaxID=230148 RepID=A0A4Z2I6Z3_9TELE|nr:hypothetical protein EYF80_016872 [Liparis tanakae]
MGIYTGGPIGLQTLSKELPMTHAVSLIDEVMPRTRSLDLHSCAGGSPLAPDCCGAGCVDCHYESGGVHGHEELQQEAKRSGATDTPQKMDLLEMESERKFQVRVRLTKKPAQNGQDCLTRAEEVKAMLVKEKARTMAPRPRWHSPR